MVKGVACVAYGMAPIIEIVGSASALVSLQGGFLVKILFIHVGCLLALTSARQEHSSFVSEGFSAGTVVSMRLEGSAAR